LIWGLVIDKVATLEELETTYSIDDALRVSAARDAHAALEKGAME